MDVLIDALTMRDVVVGLRPVPRSIEVDISNYLITLHEYLFLLEVATEEMLETSAPSEIREVDDLLDRVLGARDWCAFNLDVEMINDIYGTSVEIISPSASRLRHVTAVQDYYRLDVRDALNLLAAEEREVPFLVQSGLVNRAVEDAFADRGVPILMAA